MCNRNITGTVFDVQRFSVHDGPGIRTTVFMKGCSLRCSWCHNPEGLSARPQLRFIKERCIGCGSCGSRERLADAEQCPAQALTVCGQTVTVEEILEQVLKDREFYAGHGGVTFSGGECLLQAGFVSAVCQELKKTGIHTAVDTAGYVPWENIEKSLEYCDLYLYDVKCWQAEKHKKYTGADNALILENLQKLSKTGKEIWIRVPVIPGFNQDKEEMMAVAGFVAGLEHVGQVNLIPYHALGFHKYETLGMSCPYDAGWKLLPDELEACKRIFRERNLSVV